jgi:hypothetical protein
MLNGFFRIAFNSVTSMFCFVRLLSPFVQIISLYTELEKPVVVFF